MFKALSLIIDIKKLYLNALKHQIKAFFDIIVDVKFKNYNLSYIILTASKMKVL